MEIKSWGDTDLGRKRQKNEDSILVNKNLHIYAVADGMGGHKDGKKASSMVVQITEEVFKKEFEKGKIKNPENIIKKSYKEAAQQVYEANVKQFKKAGLFQDDDSVISTQGMGTTLVMAFIYDGICYVGNVGDSRAYLFSEKEKVLWQLTEDHSLVYEELKQGLITVEEMETSSQKNIITKSIGFKSSVEPDIFERPIQDGDSFLLCSDGLCGLASNNEIQDICSKKPEQDVVSSCIKKANDNGGADNISVIYIRCQN